jgi:hypothetical protein
VPEYKAAKVEGPDKPDAAQLPRREDAVRQGQGQDRHPLQRASSRCARSPLEAYDYVVNGKPAIEWVMERQSVTTDKDSGIVKDANAWATETVGDVRATRSRCCCA